MYVAKVKIKCNLIVWIHIPQKLSHVVIDKGDVVQAKIFTNTTLAHYTVIDLPHSAMKWKLMLHQSQ